MPPVRYEDDYKREGEPRRSRSEGSPMSALGEDMGPLPVWGWIAVAVGAVFLYRRMAGKGGLSASTSPTATLPAYPAGADAGTIINDYRTTTPTSPGVSSPAGAIAPTQTTASGWGPSWPDKAPGVVPDRPCPPGQFVVTNFTDKWWSCETYQQISGLMAALPLFTPGPQPTTAPAGSTTTSCPAGYSLTATATGLTCIPVATAQAATAGAKQ